MSVEVAENDASSELAAVTEGAVLSPPEHLLHEHIECEVQVHEPDARGLCNEHDVDDPIYDSQFTAVYDLVQSTCCLDSDLQKPKRQRLIAVRRCSEDVVTGAEHWLL